MARTVQGTGRWQVRKTGFVWVIVRPDGKLYGEMAGGAYCYRHHDIACRHANFLARTRR